MSITNHEQDALFGTMIRVENKDIFVDLKKNKNGIYLKISERNRSSRNTVLIPASGISRLHKVLEDVLKIETNSKSTVSRERKNRLSSDPDVSARSIYVTGLSWDTTDEELASHFGSAGTVIKSVILRQRRRGQDRSMGCGVVEFSAMSEAAVAIKTLNETEFKTRLIRCREDRLVEASTVDSEEVSDDEVVQVVSKPVASVRARSSVNTAAAEKKAKSKEDKIPDTTRVFVKNLPEDVNSEDLSFFAEAGAVASVQLLSTRRIKGAAASKSAIIEFVSSASSAYALLNMNERDLNGHKIMIREYFL